MRVSFRTYSIITILLTFVVVYGAYDKYKQFYLTGLYLATAKHALLIFTNLVAVLAYLLGKIFVIIYLDRIHERELDLLNDKIKSSITDTILALTIFREHFNTQFVFLFLFLLFFQVFHWLSKYRVEYLEHSPYDFKKNLRLIALLVFLLLVDSVFLYFSVKSLFIPSAPNKSDLFAIGYTFQPNLMVLFSLEFGLLFITGITTFIQLFINIEGIKREGRWDNKGIYILYLEFFSEAFKTLLYSCFFAITIIHYGIPIHIIRQLFISFRTFIRRLQDILQYQNIMNERFADATEQELENTDRICIVCREDMVTGKKLPCGHILHLHCLRSWLERQQTCPICRAQVIIHDPNQPQNLLQRIFRRRPPPGAQVPVQPQPQAGAQPAQQPQAGAQPAQPIPQPPQPPQLPPDFQFPNFGANHMFQIRRHHFAPPPPFLHRIVQQRQQQLQQLQHPQQPQQINQEPQQPGENIPQPTTPNQPPFSPSLFGNTMNSPFSIPPVQTNNNNNNNNNNSEQFNINHLQNIQNHLAYLYNQIDLLKQNLGRPQASGIISENNLNNVTETHINTENIKNDETNNTNTSSDDNNSETQPQYELVELPDNTNKTTTTTTTNTSQSIDINSTNENEPSYEDQIRQRVSKFKQSKDSSSEGF